MPQTDSSLQNHPAFAALVGRTAAESSSLLSRIAGTHALLLDAIEIPSPQAAGLGRWITLRLTEHGDFQGALRADSHALPFCDNSFGAVLIRFLTGAGLPPKRLVDEVARVLAPHGVLLVIEFHPVSAWRPWWAARRRRGETRLRAVAPRRWQRALRGAGLAVGEPVRCGPPWPSTRSLPRWLELACGGGWLLTARKRDDAPAVQRLQPRRARVVSEHAPWIPGAHRARA